MKNPVIVYWSTNWADEMDIEGWAIMEEEDWKKYKKDVRLIKNGFSLFVGTNEEIEYSSGSALLKELHSKKISVDEYKVLMKIIGEEEFGHCDFLYALEMSDDQNDWDDE
jgi:hypothetical protein